MNAYTVTVVDSHRKRHSYPMIAASWYEAFVTAINEYGMTAFVCVKPMKARKA